MRALVVYESMYGNTHAVAANVGSGLTLDPDAAGPGLRAWLTELNAEGGFAAAFDTQLSGVSAPTGRTAWGIARLLTRRGALVGETARAAVAASKRS